MKLVLTEDGSHTLRSEQFDETYHSHHGAVAESMHVYIQNGLAAVDRKEINVFEVGFGTGLDALLSWMYAEQNDLRVNYTGLELYPISDAMISEINHPSLLQDYKPKFGAIHAAAWGGMVRLSPIFKINKLHQSVLDFTAPADLQDVIYFDAFSPDKQPELWTADVFRKMYEMLDVGGVLVTYCSKSAVRRNMEEVGFTVEKLQGPRGKREMVRAVKNAK
jgi:tRNA U34 5-methylaminomethyl-2-thiouridine-forming methyltransferase MnmC